MRLTTSSELRQYLLITGNYWAFTLTDGALRMLVVLHFHGLGYSPLEIALLFLFYEFFGIVTNLIGGWLGARIGLNHTMNLGLALQIVALSMLLVNDEMLTVLWVMLAQALSGIAKDLNKMSAKSAIKTLLPDDAQNALYRWVAILTGSKNTLKGVGFFLGGVLLGLFGFRGAVMIMAVALVIVLLSSLISLRADLGKAKQKPKFTQLFSKSRELNMLSAARLFLFASRDVWFVVALPVYLATNLGWAHAQVGGFLALWIIFYGIIQACAPTITGLRKNSPPSGSHASLWAYALMIIPALIAIGLSVAPQVEIILLFGLFVFAVLFAINSSIHSYLIVQLADRDHVSLDVGFYYMANAGGRLFGTVLSGWIYQVYGLPACLLCATILVLLAAVFAGKVQPKRF